MYGYYKIVSPSPLPDGVFPNLPGETLRGGAYLRWRGWVEDIRAAALKYPDLLFWVECEPDADDPERVIARGTRLVHQVGECEIVWPLPPAWAQEVEP